MTRGRGIDAVVVLAWIPGHSLSLSYHCRCLSCNSVTGSQHKINVLVADGAVTQPLAEQQVGAATAEIGGAAVRDQYASMDMAVAWCSTAFSSASTSNS